MARDAIDLGEKLLAQLREEMIEAQRTRAQVIGFKITFVSTAIALLGANIATVPREVWAVPAVAAFFFDLLINSYSVSIKRLGLYCRHHLEPLLKRGHQWPEDVPTWEEFAASQPWTSRLFVFGNTGITGLAAIVASAVLLTESVSLLSVLLTAGLAALLVVDLIVFQRPQVLAPTAVDERE